MCWVLIEIRTADAMTCSHELGILGSLVETREGKLSTRYIVQILDEFTRQGSNGAHRFLVFELLGPTLEMVISDSSHHEDPEDRLESEIILNS